MYKKRKNILNQAIDPLLTSIIDEFLQYNKEASFIINKKFIDKGNNQLGDEIIGLPIIISTIPLSDLVIPSSIKLDSKGYITSWCDDIPLIRMIYSKITYVDGYIKEQKIKNLYLDIDKQNEIEQLKKYK